MEEILKKLQGGDLRSIGKVNEVVTDILADSILFVAIRYPRFKPSVIQVLLSKIENGGPAIISRGKKLLRKLNALLLGYSEAIEMGTIVLYYGFLEMIFDEIKWFWRVYKIYQIR